MTTERFRDLHKSGLFIIPNPWDVGSARLLQSLGFSALATTSSGLAAALGKRDGQVTLDELVAHCAALSAAVDIPVHVDAENCFAEDAAGVATTVKRLAEAGAAGLSIEDFSRARRELEPVDVAVERVAVAVEAAKEHGLVVTARAENLIRSNPDIDDTIARLQRYRDTGAEVVFAPGLADVDTITRVVEAVAAPLNVIARKDGPSIPELEAAGVRRVSTGGALAFSAYGALARAATELRDQGTSTYTEGMLTKDQVAAAFD